MQFIEYGICSSIFFLCVIQLLIYCWYKYKIFVQYKYGNEKGKNYSIHVCVLILAQSMIQTHRRKKEVNLLLAIHLIWWRPYPLSFFSFRSLLFRLERVFFYWSLFAYIIVAFDWIIWLWIQMSFSASREWESNFQFQILFFGCSTFEIFWNFKCHLIESITHSMYNVKNLLYSQTYSVQSIGWRWSLL